MMRWMTLVIVKLIYIVAHSPVKENSDMNGKGAPFDPFADPFMDLIPLPTSNAAPSTSAFDPFDMLTPLTPMSGDAVYATALYDYSPQMENQIGFRLGDRIKMLNIGERGGWSEGETLSGNMSYN